MADKKPEETVQITPFRKEEKARTYSNYVRVTANPSEVTLQFADVKPGSNDEEQAKLKREKRVTVPIEVEIVLPVDIAIALVQILQQQLSLIKIYKDKPKQ